MIELISIHLPKTGGTSFYQILQQVYGDTVSISFKRRDYQRCLDLQGALLPCLPPQLRVLHGHLRYSEVETIVKAHQPKLILWLRDPIERVISNYHFFIQGLQNPERNPVVYEQNKHRLRESLEVYAARDENRNRMYEFVEGARMEEFYFIGFLEYFDADLQYLANSLAWPDFQIPHANKGTISQKSEIEEGLMNQLRHWNKLDLEIYHKALDIRRQRLNTTQL